jgi:hypothetical protein
LSGGQHTQKAVAARTPRNGLSAIETRVDPVTAPEPPRALVTALGLILAFGVTALAGVLFWLALTSVL